MKWLEMVYTIQQFTWICQKCTVCFSRWNKIAWHWPSYQTMSDPLRSRHMMLYLLRAGWLKFLFWWWNMKYRPSYEARLNYNSRLAVCLYLFRLFSQSCVNQKWDQNKLRRKLLGPNPGSAPAAGILPWHTFIQDSRPIFRGSPYPSSLSI